MTQRHADSNHAFTQQMSMFTAGQMQGGGGGYAGHGGGGFGGYGDAGGPMMPGGADPSGVAPQSTLCDKLGGAIGGTEGQLVGAIGNLAAGFIPHGNTINNIGGGLL